MVEYAAGNPAFIAIRSRRACRSPLPCSTMLNAAQLPHVQKEAEVAQRIAKIEATIASVLEAAGVCRLFNLGCIRIAHGPAARTSQVATKFPSSCTRMLKARAAVLPYSICWRALLHVIGLFLRSGVSALGRLELPTGRSRDP
jgi:hypothetical protein